MDLNQALITILSQGIPASEVLLAIHDGLRIINLNALENEQKIEMVESVMLSLIDLYEDKNALAEVTLARGGHANLNARLDSIVARFDNLDTQIELNKPYYETKTRTVSIPYSVTYEDDNTLFPHESYVRVEGTNGSKTITYEEEFINGVSTGRVVNERVTATTPPVNRVEVRGTKVLNARPIRYIRVNTRVQGTTQGQIAELEIWANNQNIANRATVTLPSGTTQSNQALMFDGQRNTNANIISGNNSFIQLDLGQGYSNISRINLLLRAGLTYNVVRLEVSVDGTNWTRVYNNGNYVAPSNFNGLDFEPYIIYGDGTTFVDGSLSRQDVSVGQYITLANPLQTNIYSDSYQAAYRMPAGKFVRNENKLLVSYKAYTVNNQAPVSKRPSGDNYVILYGHASYGWFRSDEI